MNKQTYKPSSPSLQLMRQAAKVEIVVSSRQTQNLPAGNSLCNAISFKDYDHFEEYPGKAYYTYQPTIWRIVENEKLMR